MAFKEFELDDSGMISFDQFHSWIHKNQIGIEFYNEMNKISQLILGLKPNHRYKEREIIKILMNQINHKKEGDIYYLLCKSWWDQWKNYTEYDEEETPIGGGSSKKQKSFSSPISNQKITQFGQNILILKNNLKENIDYVLLPENVWNALWKWYGGGPSFSRFVVQSNVDSNELFVEVYPYTLILMLRRTTLSTLPSKRIEMTASKSPTYTFENLKIDGCKLLNISSDDYSKIHLWNAKNENHLTFIDDLSISVIDAKISNYQKIIFEMQSDDGIWPISERQLLANSMNLSKTSLPGLVGLQNLGNTCFINSAIQCLSNTIPLTEYFIKNYHLRELNRTNPIGMEGNIAKSFGKIIKSMWTSSSSSSDYVSSIYNPKKFRKTVSIYDSHLGDGAQHDAQEFLTFLMNGLHEDLNRIKNKKYEENPDGEMPDIEKAKLFWEIYLRRNQSIIVDLFQGQFRSSLTCQTCNYSSITFEPFTFLQVPLPMEKTRYFQVIFHFLDANKINIKYSVCVPSIGNCSMIISLISQLSEISTKEILLTEITKQIFRRILRNSTSINSISLDIIHAFQIPLRDRSKKKKKDKKNDEKGPLVHVSVLLRYLQVSSVYFLSPYKSILFGCPFIISFHPLVTSLHDVKQLIIQSLSSALTLNSDDSLPFDIHITSKTGDICGTCRWDCFCVGCVLKEDDVPLLTSESTITLTFKQNLLNQYDASEAEKFDEHESVKQDAEKQDLPITLDECLQLFTEAEMMDEKESWYCPKCKEFRAAIKKLDIWKVPKVLVIQLKRFHFRGRFVKISKLVDFPMNNLDLSKFVLSPEDVPEPFNLFAVLVSKKSLFFCFWRILLVYLLFFC